MRQLISSAVLALLVVLSSRPANAQPGSNLVLLVSAAGGAADREPLQVTIDRLDGAGFLNAKAKDHAELSKIMAKCDLPVRVNRSVSVQQSLPKNNMVYTINAPNNRGVAKTIQLPASGSQPEFSLRFLCTVQRSGARAADVLLSVNVRGDDKANDAAIVEQVEIAQVLTAGEAIVYSAVLPCKFNEQSTSAFAWRVVIELRDGNR